MCTISNGEISGKQGTSPINSSVPSTLLPFPGIKLTPPLGLLSILYKHPLSYKALQVVLKDNKSTIGLFIFLALKYKNG